jgi:hypothetical protein
MLVNLIVLLGGIWGFHFTWKQRHKSGCTFFLAPSVSSIKNPIAFKFILYVHFVIYGLCIIAGAYRLVFGITT